MRNISFMLTTDQIRNGTKTVTRRLGWKHLKPGTRLMACVKCQGIKKGEAIEKIREIEVVSVGREFLYQIWADDVFREGFPGMSRREFIGMFCEHMRCEESQVVTRIEFKYLPAAPHHPVDATEMIGVNTVNL